MKTLYGAAAGKINLNTGRTKYFNVLENNGPNDTLVLIKDSFNEGFTVVSGSGKGYDDYLNRPLNMKSQGRTIKHGNGIKKLPNTMESLRQIKSIIGINKCSFWVFK
jgi:hypothetical protein